MPVPKPSCYGSFKDKRGTRCDAVLPANTRPSGRRVHFSVREWRVIIRFENDELDGLGGKHRVLGYASVELHMGLVAVEAPDSEATGGVAADSHHDRIGGDDAQRRDGRVRHGLLAAIPREWGAARGNADRYTGGIWVRGVFAAVFGIGEAWTRVALVLCGMGLMGFYFGMF